MPKHRQRHRSDVIKGDVGAALDEGSRLCAEDEVLAGSGEWDGAEYTGVEGADYAVVVDGISEPAGLALHAGRLFVSEHGTGDIIAFDLEGNELDRMSTPADRIMGITIGPAGDLWYVDAGANEVVRVDP